MYGDFKEIRRFDLIDKSGLDASDIGATDINHINTKHAKSDFNEVVKTIKNYVNSGEDIKVTVIGHASERTDIQEEVVVDSKTYANKIQNWFRPSQNSEQTLKKSSDFASDVANGLKDNNISEDIIVVEYRGSQDLGFSTETDYGRDLSNRVMVAIYVIKPVGEKPVPVVAKVEEKDSDGDGVYDSKDECPDTPKGLMVDDVGCPITMTIRLNFEVDSYVIPESSKGKVVEFAEFLKGSPAFRVHIVGHTDSTGSEEYNQVLSQNRANALKNALIENGISEDRMDVSGEGELSPIETNDTAEGRAMNRRTEVKLLN